MESDHPRWRFWDFGSVQFVQDSLSGQSLRAHGPGAAFTYGPFRFVSYGDKPVLVGIDGGDEHRALHSVDEAMANVVAIEEDSQSQGEVHKVSERCGGNPSRPLRDLQLEKRLKVLEIAVEGCTHFKARFTRCSAPSLCGDQPVSIWMYFSWIVEYTMGRGALANVWLKSEAFQRALKARGFSPQHCKSSLLSRHRKRAQKGP